MTQRRRCAVGEPWPAEGGARWCQGEADDGHRSAEASASSRTVNPAEESRASAQQHQGRIHQRQSRVGGAESKSSRFSKRRERDRSPSTPSDIQERLNPQQLSSRAPHAWAAKAIEFGTANVEKRPIMFPHRRLSASRSRTVPRACVSPGRICSMAPKCSEGIRIHPCPHPRAAHIRSD